MLLILIEYTVEYTAQVWPSVLIHYVKDTAKFKEWERFVLGKGFRREPNPGKALCKKLHSNLEKKL